MPSLEDRIRAVEDRDEIRELTARYCHLVAAADSAGIVDLFCEDGTFGMGDRTTRAGPHSRSSTRRSPSSRRSHSSRTT